MSYLVFLMVAPPRLIDARDHAAFAHERAIGARRIGDDLDFLAGAFDDAGTARRHAAVTATATAARSLVFM